MATPGRAGALATCWLSALAVALVLSFIVPGASNDSARPFRPEDVLPQGLKVERVTDQVQFHGGRAFMTPLEPGFEPSYSETAALTMADAGSHIWLSPHEPESVQVLLGAYTDLDTAMLAGRPSYLVRYDGVECPPIGRIPPIPQGGVLPQGATAPPTTTPARRYGCMAEVLVDAVTGQVIFEGGTF